MSNKEYRSLYEFFSKNKYVQDFLFCLQYSIQAMDKQDQQYNKYKLQQVSKFRLQQSIIKKQQCKGVKPVFIKRYIQKNWSQYEQQQQDGYMQVLNINSSQSVQYQKDNVINNTDNAKNKFRREQKVKERQSIEDSRISNFTFQKFLLMENICLTVAYMSLFQNVLYSDTGMKKKQDIQVIILYNVSAITFILMIMTILRYYFLIQLRQDQKIIQDKSNFFVKLNRAGELWPLIIELILISFHPNVLCKDTSISQLQAYDVTTIQHELNDILALTLLLRSYIILRAIITNTKFASPRASRLCRIHLCDPNYMYSVKCILKEYPLRTLLTVFMMLLVIFGHGLKLSQGPLTNASDYKMDFTDYANCFWCVIVTMGTIGYGDYYPRTIPGRFICILTAVAGVILSSLLIVALSAYLTMTPNQSKAHICIKRLKLQKSLSDQASSAMIAIVNLGREIKMETNQKKYFKEIFANLKKNTQKVKTKMRIIKSLVDNNNIYEEMVRHFSILKNNLKEIYEKQCIIMRELQQISQVKQSRNHLNIAREVEKMVRKWHE